MQYSAVTHIVNVTWPSLITPRLLFSWVCPTLHHIDILLLIYVILSSRCKYFVAYIYSIISLLYFFSLSLDFFLPFLRVHGYRVSLMHLLLYAFHGCPQFTLAPHSSPRLRDKLKLVPKPLSGPGFELSTHSHNSTHGTHIF